MFALVLVMFAQPAGAAVDPRPDVLGVYFDEFGDRPCKDDLIQAVPFSVYFVYTNPTVNSILGFEAGYYTTAGFLQLGIFPPCGIIWTVMPDLDNLYVTCAVPLATAQATPLFRIDYLYIGFEPLESVFYLEKARDSIQPGSNPYIILADGSPMEAQAADPAYTTTFCALATEPMGWGTIKSLFR